MTQHAFGSDGKPSDAPSHKDSRKRSRESRHSAGYGCVHWTELELRGKRGAEEGKEAQKTMEVIVSSAGNKEGEEGNERGGVGGEERQRKEGRRR